MLAVCESRSHGVTGGTVFPTCQVVECDRSDSGLCLLQTYRNWTFNRKTVSADHFLTTFQFTVMDYTAVGIHLITGDYFHSPLLLSSLLYANTVQSSSSHRGRLSRSVTSSLCTTLDAAAPLQTKASHYRYLSPRCNSQTRTWKQMTCKLERTKRLVNLEGFYLAWKNRLLLYLKRALCKVNLSLI